MSLLERVERLQTGTPEDISRFIEGICPDWIGEALQACGKPSIRSRKLRAEKVLWLVIGMALFSDRSIQKVIEHLGLVIDGLIQSSAVTRACQKLGADPLIWLFHRVAKSWGTYNEKWWKGPSLYGLDGTHLRVDDSEENDRLFGRPKGRASVGYPQLRLLALMNLTSRLLTAAAVGEWDKSEMALAKNLWGQIPENSLAIVDRGFLSHGFILSFYLREPAAISWSDLSPTADITLLTFSKMEAPSSTSPVQKTSRGQIFLCRFILPCA